jgi:hypothetical protein
MQYYFDADSLIYAAGFCNQSTVVRCFGGEYTKLTEAYEHWVPQGISKEEIKGECTREVFAADISHSIQSLKHMLTAQCTRAQKAYGEGSVELFLTGKGNFRELLYPKYKADRTPESKPVHYQELKDYMIKHLGAQLVHNMEADDKVSTSLWENQGSGCIIAVDKDLLNTPGMHYNPKKELAHIIVLDEANRNFLMQLLTGDSTDNIPGLGAVTEPVRQEFELSAHSLKGCGEKTAQRIYARLKGNFLEKYQQIEELYDKSPCELDCLTNAKLLWMARGITDGQAEQFIPNLLMETL